LKFCKTVQRSTLTLLAAGSIATSLPIHADAISGAIAIKVTKQEVLPVTAQSGDMLMLAESHGTNKSGNWMDDAEVVNKEIDFLLKGSGPQHGYITFSKGADSVDVKWSGYVQTMMVNGQPRVSFHGTWEHVQGTGRYQGTKGKGTYKGHFTSQTEYVIDWVGQANVAAAGKWR
jgi:hypothetical protein